MSTDGSRPLPVGWRWVRLGEVIAQAQAGFATSERDPQGVVQLRMNNVTNQGGFDWSNVLRVPADAATVGFYRLDLGDVLFNNTNSTELVGKSAWFDGYSEDVVYSNHFTRLRVRDALLDARYLHLWLHLQWQQRLFEQICNRWIGQSAVQRDKLLRLELPLAPLEEQRRIVARLNEQMVALERAHVAAQTQVEAAQALQAAYLREVFESKEARTWKRVHLSDHVSKVGSGITPRGGHRVYLQRGVPLIRSQNVHMNEFRYDGLVFISPEQDCEMEKSRVLPSDVLLNITGASIGRVCVAPNEIGLANVNQHVSVIRTQPELNADFLAFYISTPKFQKHMLEQQAGATRQALTKSMIENFEIPLPPVSVQTEISNRLSLSIHKAMQLLGSCVSQMELVSGLSSTFLRQAFAGEL